MEEQFPVPRYTAASKIGNGVISLLWQLRCGCNPDHNKVSSFSNTTVVSIFPNLCLWRRRLLSNLGGINLEKLYRATLIYSLLFSLFLQHYHISERLRRATKRGKFWFDRCFRGSNLRNYKKSSALYFRTDSHLI